MSIIERMAELLGPVEKPSSRPSASGEKSNTSDLDAIERAVMESAKRPGFPEAREPTAAPRSQPGQAPSSKTARKLTIDLNRLRQQSIITPDGGRTPMTESFRRIKREILANVANPKAGAPANLVLVTSALPGEGKTFCAINLAISIALEMDRTVLLVDADVAKPSIPKVLGIGAGRGLMDVLLDRGLDVAEVLWRTDIEKLTLVTAGTAHKHATELLASDTMRTLLHEMAGRYHDRVIIFDSPPLLAASEAGALASHMGQIVIVVEAGRTPETALKAALGCIKSNNVTGLLLNKGDHSRLGYGYDGYD
jgi:protein-tyrosine kinase